LRTRHQGSKFSKELPGGTSCVARKLQMIVNHDDGEREYEYAVETVNHLAAENRWHVISMKKDWERVFDF
jgi:hypothetical protein